MDALLNGISLRVIQGEISELALDALVITVDRSLKLDPTSYPDKTLLAKGGPILTADSPEAGLHDVGAALLAPAGELAAKHLIYALGPRMSNDNARGKLASVTWNALHLASEQAMKAIAFYPISVGRFGYPVEGCAGVMAQKVVDFTFEELAQPKTIVVCVENESLYTVFAQAFRREIDAAQDEVGTTG